MSTVGIVCEYNPFHRGHEYQIKKCRELLGDDTTIVCVMSGDFVQRGEAAVFSKYARAEAACRCGADLVAELPLPWCLSSAEGYARGAVSILAGLGAEYICFGTETDELDALENISALLCDRDIVEKIIAELQLNDALSFAAARQTVLERYVGKNASLLQTPNNILAVEYLKALRELELNIKPLAIKRYGAEHDSAQKTADITSATEVRRMIYSGEDIGDYVPEEAMRVYENEVERGRLIDKYLLDTAIISRLRVLDETAYERLRDGGSGFGRRVYNALRQCSSVDAVAYQASTRRYAYSRVKRLCMCAALNITPKDAEGLPPYTRLLAANDRGCALLRENKNSGICIITKPATARHMDKGIYELFIKVSAAHDLYVLGYTAENERNCDADWKIGPQIVHNT